MQNLQYGAIGMGGRGGADIGSLTNHSQIKIVAAADVDKAVFPQFLKKHEEAKTFTDWREMLGSMADAIDVVSVSTPDHMHGIQALSAMNLGKHVYVQKPLAQTIAECRAMEEAARRNEVIVQMGTQGASSFYDRAGIDYVRRLAVGKITEAWGFCGKGWGDSKPMPEGEDPVPEGLDWDGWLGVGEDRPYLDKYYHPKNWRRRQDFGTGTLGDMGCHIFHAMYRGLELTAPRRVRSSTAVPNMHNWTGNERVEYEFPETAYTDGDLKVTWLSGSQRSPDELLAMIPEGVKFRFGCILKGSEGAVLLRHGSAPLMLPAEKFGGIRPEKLEPIGHHAAFVDAILGGDRSKMQSPIDHAARLTEFILLGNISMQHTPDWLDWDAGQMRITNHDAANDSLRRSYRSGWKTLGT